MSVTEFSKIPNIVFSFGEMLNPWPLGAGFHKDERIKIKLVHGTRILVANLAEKNLDNFTDADGALTRLPQAGLAVSWADCVPILAARNDGTSVAAVHAGWRGTKDGIATELSNTIKHLGDHPRDWSAIIGPSIRKCCYQVGVDVAASFGLSDTHIDLAEINANQLHSAGFSRVEIESPCTYCTQQVQGSQNSKTNGHSADYRYFSFRRDKTTERQWATVKII